VDDDGNVTERHHSRSTGPRRNTIFAGIARKLAVVVLFLLGVSWSLFVAGVIEDTRKFNLTDSDSLSVPMDFGTWSTCVVGFFAILAAVGHAGAYGGASTAMGVFTAILGMLFIASSGYVGLSIANILHFDCVYAKQNCSIGHTTVFELSGALGMCVLWACLAALWPFYFKETDAIRNSRRNDRVHQHYMRHQVQEDGETEPLLQGHLDNQRNRSHFSVF